MLCRHIKQTKYGPTRYNLKYENLDLVNRKPAHILFSALFGFPFLIFLNGRQSEIQDPHATRFEGSKSPTKTHSLPANLHIALSYPQDSLVPLLEFSHSHTYTTHLDMGRHETSPDVDVLKKGNDPLLIRCGWWWVLIEQYDFDNVLDSHIILLFVYLLLFLNPCFWDWIEMDGIGPLIWMLWLLCLFLIQSSLCLWLKVHRKTFSLKYVCFFVIKLIDMVPQLLPIHKS